MQYRRNDHHAPGGIPERAARGPGRCSMKPRAMTGAIIALMMAMPAAAAPVSVSIGHSVWCSWWEPTWKNGKFFIPPASPGLPVVNPVSIGSSINEFRMDPALMHGPLISINFLDKWSVSTLFMYGKFRAISSGPRLQSFFVNSRYRKEIDRYDSDSTINYSFNKIVKVFVGFKYQSYRYLEKLAYWSLTEVAVYRGLGRSEFESMGPGAGLGITIPLPKNFFILGSLAASYFWGSGTYRFDDLYYYSFTTATYYPYLFQYEKEYFTSIAGNGSLSLAYYLAPANLTLGLGGRYQVMWHMHERKKRGFLYYNGRYDHFWGITISVVYSFTLGNTKPGA